LKTLLERFVPSLAVNLANLHREGVFPTAQHPSMLFIGRNRIAEKGAELVLAVPDRKKDFKRHGTIEVEPVHLKTVSVCRAAREESFLKIAAWGSARDAALIDHLRSFSPLEEVLQRLNVEARQGFIRGKPEQRTRDVDPILLATPHPCLEKTGFQSFELAPSSLDVFSDDKLQWPRDALIYEAPLVLVRLGIGERGVEAAFCDKDVVYSQRFYGLRVPAGKERWGNVLNGVLNSSVTTYYIFLTAVEWGVERDNVTWADVRRLPVPLPTTSGQTSLVRIVKKLRAKAREGEPVLHEDYELLDEAVFDVYGLDADQRVLIEDMVGPTLDLHRKAEASEHMLPARHEELVAYAERFTGVIDGYLAVRGASKLVAEVYGLPESSSLRVVKLRLVDRASAEPALSNVPMSGLEPLLERIAETLPDTMRERLHTRRHLRIYGEGELYVMKPNQRRYWTRSAGLNDADAVLAEHMRHL